MKGWKRLAIVPLVLMALEQPYRAQGLTFSLFERYLESLRQQAEIPGLSAAIIHNRQIVWERGFGYQDLEHAIVPTSITPYVIGDLTQVFSAALVMQCVERGTVALDDPIAPPAPGIEPGTTLRQVLSHAAPGTKEGFKYNPSRYAALTGLIDDCRDEPYRKALAEDLLDHLVMFDSVPGHDLAVRTPAFQQLFDARTLDRYSAVLERLAIPYKSDSKGRFVRSEYPPRDLNAAWGVISTIRDLARYDAALEDRGFILPESVAASWTNTVLPNGVVLPTGLGWFVQNYNGERVIWHFGLAPSAFSSLIVKIPGRNMTLILLANSDGLSAPFPLANGDVTVSVFAKLFLRLFL